MKKYLSNSTFFNSCKIYLFSLPLKGLFFILKMTHLVENTRNSYTFLPFLVNIFPLSKEDKQINIANRLSAPSVYNKRTKSQDRKHRKQNEYWYNLIRLIEILQIVLHILYEFSWKWKKNCFVFELFTIYLFV